ncbi:MAG: hydantoinase B/oxoprolinase family protein, partial [Sneathiella sp.]|nr:hydantoinase B/oxoprolinase family protein [Sneathiella sp.]
MVNPTGSVTTGEWQFWVDRGGTFTDLVARRPDGDIVTHKLLSENPEQYEDAALQGIRDLLGLGKQDDIPAEKINAVKMGTTVATNALLERKGEPLLLVTTKGFRDSLRIGYQTRPKLFALHIELPEMLYKRVIEVEERIGANGELIRPLNADAARKSLQEAYDAGLRACAIVFMHGYRYPGHEQQVAKIAKEIGFTQISTSHETSPLMKLVSRGDTTVVDAYLSPILRRYVDRVASELGDTRLMFMQSNGGLTDARFFQGKDAILSGPAGGVVGMVQTSAMAGFTKVIGFDMGGTSTDVSHYGGEYERTFETEVAGVRMRAPMMLINTVAAGGGSILHFDGARYKVGPDSAGADPGPACYRKDGPLTVTDCNVMLGKLAPEFFPKVFGPNADEALDVDIVRERFAELSDKINAATGDNRTPEEVARGFLFIAVENMANAIKKISVQRGYDVSEYVLTSFGGAGGQHACMVADSLGMKKIMLHPYAGVLSAFGMGLADLRVLKEKAMEVALDTSALPGIGAALDGLAIDGHEEMRAQGVEEKRITIERKLHIKYQGSDTSMVVDDGPLDDIISAFEAAHRQRFGFNTPEKTMIVEAVAVEVIGAGDRINDPEMPETGAPADAKPLSRREIFVEDQWQSCPFFDRDTLPAGAKIDGPAVIVESTGTTVIEPGWQAETTRRGHLILTRVEELKRARAIGTEVDPVMLEIFNNLFMNVAEQMGTVLEKTAYSVNIKERLDFSCAVFDLNGDLIANAPHMPVNLGSMSESIKAVISKHGATMKAGDVF